jgi:lamin B
LVRKSGENETLFKFHRTVKVEAGQVITIWSSDSGATHEPPTNIVMKGQRFFVSDNMSTRLVNGDGEVRAMRKNNFDHIANSDLLSQEVATHERKLVQRSIHREFGYRGIEDFHHQQVSVNLSLCISFLTPIIFPGRSSFRRRKVSYYVNRFSFISLPYQN